MFKKTAVLFLLIIFGLLIMPALTNAATSHACPFNTLAECQEWALSKAGGPTWGEANPNIQSTEISQKVGQIIGYVLAFLGVAFLVIVVYSGIQWMTAGGNTEVVTKARTRLVNGAIGLAIALSAYAITWFVVYKLTVAECPVICTQDGSSCSGQTLSPSTCPAGSFCCISAEDDCTIAGYACSSNACTGTPHPELTCYGPAAGYYCCDQ